MPRVAALVHSWCGVGRGCLSLIFMMFCACLLPFEHVFCFVSIATAFDQAPMYVFSVIYCMVNAECCLQRPWPIAWEKQCRQLMQSCCCGCKKCGKELQ